jgi:hypothetical protein
VRSVALNHKYLPYAVALSLAASAALMPAPVHGMTLGNIAAQSSLGQPLRVVIPVQLGQGETLNTACLKLVADNRAGGAPQIVTARVSIDMEGASPRVIITRAAMMDEPAARISLQVGCGNTTRRDYVLFFDPAALQPPTMVASADEDPAYTRMPRQPAASAIAVAKAAPSAPAPVEVATSALPHSTWGIPVELVSPVRESKPPVVAQAAPVEPKQAAPVVIAENTSNAGPRELVTVASTSGSSMFIQEAAAANLPARALAATTVATANAAQSLPLAGPAQRNSASATAVWAQVWPFAAMIFGSMALAVVGFTLHRRFSSVASWMDPKARESLKGETQAGATQATFAHFGAMTEPAQRASHSPLELPARADSNIEVSELDTLLQDIQADIIDERTIKNAYRAVADEGSTDMGSASILKAIADAERDLQIGAPEPRQAALDHSLDNDLMTVPNVSKGIRFA